MKRNRHRTDTDKRHIVTLHAAFYTRNMYETKREEIKRRKGGKGRTEGGGRIAENSRGNLAYLAHTEHRGVYNCLHCAYVTSLTCYRQTGTESG